jgi:hypothetical protein
MLNRVEARAIATKTAQKNLISYWGVMEKIRSAAEAGLFCTDYVCTFIPPDECSMIEYELGQLGFYANYLPEPDIIKISW